MKGRIINIEDYEEAVNRGIKIGIRIGKRLARVEAQTSEEYFKVELHGNREGEEIKDVVSE